MTERELQLLNETGMTTGEKALIDITVSLWNGFIALPETHPNERAEMPRKIHDIQNMIAARHVFAKLNKV